MSKGKVDVLLGLQWGDEGKGKIVDVLAPQYDIIARFQGGPNAGHTLEFEGIKHVLHTIPSGIFRKDVINVIGNGVVIDPIIFVKELEKLDAQGVDYKDRLLISKKAHLIIPSHKALDEMSELAKGDKKIGSTKKGIGPVYMDKTGRNGLRVGDILSDEFTFKVADLHGKHIDLLNSYDGDKMLISEFNDFYKAIEKLKELTFIDSEHYLNNALKEGKSILAEGAQGTMLDIDFGTYPYVTSSNTTTAGVCTGLGIAPNKIGKVIGIVKAYTTRVGSGPFPTELDNELGEQLRKQGNEYGSTTGRERRCGWLDLVQLNYACMLNGVTEIALMKSDVLDNLEYISVATNYELTPGGELTSEFPFEINDNMNITYTNFKGWNCKLQDNPENTEFNTYVNFIENELNVPISIVSYGPNRSETMFKQDR